MSEFKHTTRPGWRHFDGHEGPFDESDEVVAEDGLRGWVCGVTSDGEIVDVEPHEDCPTSCPCGGCSGLLFHEQPTHKGR